MSLQEKLDALKRDSDQNFPEEVSAVIYQGIAELVASGQAERALKAGDRAPAFDLPNSDGEVVRSSDLLSEGPVVVSFYRGVWCPLCNLELQALEEAHEEIRAMGATLVAISPQTPANSRKSQRENKLRFPVLSDRGNDIAHAFGLRFRVNDAVQRAYLGFGVNLPQINGEPSWTLPMAARYVIDRDGVLAYGEVNADYTRRPEPSDLFPVLRRCAP